MIPSHPDDRGDQPTEPASSSSALRTYRARARLVSPSVSDRPSAAARCAACEKIRSLLRVYTLRLDISFRPTARRTPLRKFIVSSKERLRAYRNVPYERHSLSSII